MGKVTLRRRLKNFVLGLRGRRVIRAAEPVAPVPAKGADEWLRVQDVFLAALSVPASERASYVTSATGDDAEFAAKVLGLIQAHESDGPLDALRKRVLGSSRSVFELAGESLLHYEILERLEGGGMGVVYRARDVRLHRTVALKFLSSHLVADPEAKERFLVEACATATLEHPNLCTVHEAGETDEGHLYIAMEFYDGETLKRRIARGRVAPAEALGIVAQVARGLACAAEQRIVHRDIKPGNLMLTTDGTIKIVDFGLAKIGDSQLTLTGTRMGTVSYMSPEQTRGEPVDQRTDVWSMGVVLYELLTGTQPFRGGSDQAIIHAILNDEPDPIEEVTPGLGPGVASLVERAMRKEASERYASAEGFLSHVEPLAADPDR